MKVIDLTHNIKTGMMVFPGDPKVTIEDGLVHEKDYCHVDKLNFGSHTGTHIDAPYHFLKEGKLITDFPAESFVKRGTLIDLTHIKDRKAITREDLEKSLVGYEEGDAIVIRTDYSKLFGKEGYLDHPFISKEAAEFIVEIKASIVAIDFLNVDPTLYESWEAHPILLSNDIFIVENLTELDKLSLSKKYTYSFLPLKIFGADGSPVRAIAMEI